MVGITEVSCRCVGPDLDYRGILLLVLLLLLLLILLLILLILLILLLKL